MWHAFQAGNGIGSNNNNNSVGGIYFDTAYCTAWMAKRCDTEWVNERAITVQWDKNNINVSIASFLIVRPAYAWLGGGRMWNDGECRRNPQSTFPFPPPNCTTPPHPTPPHPTLPPYHTPQRFGGILASP